MQFSKPQPWSRQGDKFPPPPGPRPGCTVSIIAQPLPAGKGFHAQKARAVEGFFGGPGTLFSVDKEAPESGISALRRFQSGRFADQRYPSSASFRPISTPMAEDIIKPRVHPEESPRQWSPRRLVLKSVSIFTRLE